ncbi:MAG: hypothetical protein MHM6MM_008996, partial [Cercozoa sp. M6MM]
LHQNFAYVAERVLAIVLAHCDRDGGLGLLSETLCRCMRSCKCGAPGFRRLWAELFERTFSLLRSRLAECDVGGLVEMVKEESMHDDAQHKLQFPFARATLELMESLRERSESAAVCQKTTIARSQAMVEYLRTQLRTKRMTKLFSRTAGKLASKLWEDACAVHLNQNAFKAHKRVSRFICRWLRNECDYLRLDNFDVSNCVVVWWHQQAQTRALRNLLQQLIDEIDLENWLLNSGAQGQRDSALTLVSIVCDHATSKAGRHCLLRFKALRPLLLAFLEACGANEVDTLRLVDRCSILADALRLDTKNRLFHSIRGPLTRPTNGGLQLLKRVLKELLRQRNFAEHAVRDLLLRVLRHVLQYYEKSNAVCRRALELPSDSKCRHLFSSVSSCVALFRLLDEHCDDAEFALMDQLQVEFERGWHCFEASLLACARVALSAGENTRTAHVPPSNAREALSTALIMQHNLTDCVKLCLEGSDDEEQRLASILRR